MGGALFNHLGSVTSTNSTFTQNTATGGAGAGAGSGLGGGIFNLNGNVVVINSTLVGNSVVAGAGSGGTATGGAIYNLAYGNDIATGGATSATLSLTNSILANSGHLAVDLVNNEVDGNHPNTATVTSLDNLVRTSSGSGITGTPFLTSDPVLGPLQNNGGPTQTMELLDGSPALGAGASASAPATDQRGVPRLNGTSLGAYQASVTQFSITGFPQVQTAGVAGTFSVTAEDSFGKTAFGFSGPVSLGATGQATLPANPTLTDATGIFSATLFTAGAQAVYATTQGHISAEDVLVEPASPAAVTALVGNSQSAAPGATFGTPLEVLVTDTFGNPVSGASVTFAAPATGPSGTFAASATVMTNDLGLALAPAFTANGVTGSYTVTATVSGVTTPALFSLTNAATPTTSPVVAGTTTALSVTLTPLPDDPGLATLTATVTGGSAAPTGIVLFFDVFRRHHHNHSRFLGFAVLSGSNAVLPVSLPEGPNQLLAVYTGDSNTGGSAAWMSLTVPSGSH
jgi:hypothetical protein